MVYALRRDVGVRVDEAVVLRTSPNRVFQYPLDEHWFARNERALIARLQRARTPKK